MFIHNVFFWLKEKDNAEAREALQAGLETLKGIASIKQAFVGTAAATRRPVIDATYDFAEILIFEDEAGHDIYQVHALHQKFIADCAHLWDKVVIYDVEA